MRERSFLEKSRLYTYFKCLVVFRCQYLSNAVLQAKSANSSKGLAGPTPDTLDNGLLEQLEGKLAVLRFQMKIKEELEALASRIEAMPSTSDSVQNEMVTDNDFAVNSNITNTARQKAKELSLELKTITQLYNEYAVPFELWEVIILSFLLH